MKPHFTHLVGLIVPLSLGSHCASAAQLEAATTAAAGRSVSGAGHSMTPIITPDGRFVVFMSQANNLVTNDDLRPHLDLFIRDLELSTTTLLSADAAGMGGGDGDSSHLAISTNAQYVLFASYASNLVPGDTNNASDVLLRDLFSGITELVSVTPAGRPASSPAVIPAGSPFLGSSKPAMTPDARWVVFESTAHNLVADDTNGIADVFVRDMQSRTTTLVSIGAQASIRTNQGGITVIIRGASSDASISPDARRIAFVSSAANLFPGRTNHNGDIYVRDVQLSNTFWASSNLTTYFNNEPDGYWCANPVISPDGRYVVFKGGTNRSVVHFFYHDLDTASTIVVATNSHPNTRAAFSADGRWLAFEENSNMYVRDILAATNHLVSIDGSDGPANGVSHTPVISPDGLWIAFVSTATNLIAGMPASATNRSQVYLHDVVGRQTYLISAATNEGQSDFSINGTLLAMSADASRVVFDTDASDLVPDDGNRAYDIFLRDVRANATRLISEAHPARLPATGLQSAGIYPDSISADGQRIAFSAFDDPRVPSDTNRYQDVFVNDLATGATLPISNASGAMSTNAAASDPIISANGEYVVYLHRLRTSDTWNYGQPHLYWRPVIGGSPLLITPRPYVIYGDRTFAAISADGSTVVYRLGPNVGEGLFWTNMIAGTGGAVDLNHFGYPARNANSRNTVFSSNGRLIAFVTSEPNQLSNWVGGIHMFVRDLSRSNSTRLLSVDTNGVGLPYARTYAGVFSPGDRYVAFWGTYDSNNAVSLIYRHDLQTTQNVFVASNAVNAAISADGNIIAYNQGNVYGSNVFVANLSTGERRLISRNFSGDPNPAFRDCSPPLLTPDGRFVVFASRAGDLVGHDTNRVSDVFVHDRVQQTTLLISRSRFAPGSAAALSSGPVMSADGRTVIFQSFAGDLVEGDYNERRDIFLLKLGLGDSDSDGMDDDWEVAYFGNVNHDGSGDLDSDGQSDLQEFLAGTDPTNEGSALRVLTVNPMGGGSTTIMWAAVPNRHYVVQFKDSLAAPNWSNASGVLTASSNSESFLHPSSAAQRYYRVIAVQ